MATERALRAVSVLTLAGAAAIAVAGCSPSNTSPSTHAAASSAAARARAAASSTAVQDDKNNAVNNILTPCIQAASGLSSLKSCVEGKLPAPARQQAVKCLLIAGLHGGQKSVEGPAGQACIAAALGGPSAPPSASGSATAAPPLHATPAGTIVVHPAASGSSQ
jgi:hypothetical protein